tara:strand:- start:234 stop:473 length:240 start_codon:yes stop_codon:yes gene_type:complete
MSLPFPNSFKQGLLTKLSKEEKINLLKRALKHSYKDYSSIVDIFLESTPDNGGLDEDDISRILSDHYGDEIIEDEEDDL